jgi:Kdo2-lipid IVA lauroyltransferase/acyltransferase
VIRIGLFVLWLLHLLPLALLAGVGRATGTLLYPMARARRKVTLTNLKLCFPEWSEAERERVARLHFQVVARCFLEHCILWWASKERIQKFVRVEGLEHWQAVQGKPVIWLAPHFSGLDMGGSRIITEWRGVSVYSAQKNPLFDRVVRNGRTRFVTPVLFSRQDGIRPVVKAMREGLPLYYLPDMDFGARDALFVPFFNVPAAIITGLSRMARLARAVVVPAVTRQLPGSQGYVLQFYPAWENYPTDDIEADTRRMNAFIEARVREMPEQYYWVHKRFKTRPPGERSPYE